jgi:hypothetical protein
LLVLSPAAGAGGPSHLAVAAVLNELRRIRELLEAIAAEGARTPGRPTY